MKLALAISAVAAGSVHGMLRGANTDYDCDVGCSMDHRTMGPPVCGEDGNTYFNECLAVCQDVAIAKKGACPGDPPRADDTYDEEAFIDGPTMRMFQTEKFKFVSKRKFKPFQGIDSEDFVEEEPAEEEDDIKGNKGNKPGKPDKPKKKIKALRITMEEGYEFMADVTDNEGAHSEEDLEPNIVEDDGEDGGERMLGIYGTDQRTKVYDFWTWPNKLTGEMDYGTGEGGCTATVLSRTSALTAGHCVYSRSSNSWLPHNTLAPSRYRSGSTTNEPYYEWTAKYMTTYVGWTRDGYRSYDMAVVEYYPRWDGRYIGDVVGYAGMTGTRWSDPWLDSDIIKGYPYDKPNGEMWKSGPCTHTYYSGDYLSKHYCDTVGAMSGSAVMNSSGYIHAIHVAGSYYDRSKNDQVRYNIAVLMNGRNFNNALAWAGR